MAGGSTIAVFNDMNLRTRSWRIARLTMCAALCLAAGGAVAEPVRVRQPEGSLHGFLALRTLSGATIADGDLVQEVRGGLVTSRLTFHFKDGSVHDETAVFSQRGRFRLVSDRLVQKGASFPHPLEMAIDARGGIVTVQYSEDGKARTVRQRMKLPADLSNGLTLTLLKNVPAGRAQTFSFVAATPKPRLVKLAVSPAAGDRFTTGGVSREARHFVVKVEIGGLSGLLAPLLGRQPPDSHVWVLGGVAPAFVKSEQPLYPGGPVWRIELVAPTWPHEDFTPHPAARD